MGIAAFINKQSKGLDIPSDFVEKLLEAVKAQNPPSQHTKANIKPSKSHCLRQMYYILSRAKANEVSSTDPKLTLIQKVGTFIHSTIQEALSGATDLGIVFRKPEEVVKAAQERGIHTLVVPAEHSLDNPYECHCYNSDYDISFMFDGALYFRNLSIILEIKSEDHFKNIKRIAADPEHIDQACYYSLGLGINKVLFLYVNRNYMNAKAYLVDLSDDDRQRVKNQIGQAKEAVKTNTLPATTLGKACKYCDYTKICKQNLNVIPPETIEPESGTDDSSEGADE